jgi:hypothetical protein
MVVLFDGVRMSGVVRLKLLPTVRLRYDDVALRSVQNSPAVSGSVPGIVRELKLVVEM